MRIQHNIMAMNSYRNYTNNANALSKNLEKLSSGYKINRAGDDAAGLAISEKMRAQIQGLNAAQKNVKDGISLVKTAEGAMQEIQDMLSRMKYLATQSANGTYDDAVDRKALQDEVDSLVSEINRIAASANFNGTNLLDGTLAGTEDPQSLSNEPQPLAGGPTPLSAKYKIDETATVTASVGGSLAAVTFTGTTVGGDGAVTVGALDQGTISVTVSIGGEDVKLEVTLTSVAAVSESGVSDDGLTVQFAEGDTLDDIKGWINEALMRQVQEKQGHRGNADEVSDKGPYITGVEINFDGDGKITGATISSATFVEDTSGGDTKVPAKTKVSVDLSEILGEGKTTFTTASKVTIGGVEFKFVAAGSSNAMGLAGAAVTVALGADDDESFANLVKAINENADLKAAGITASYDKDTGEFALETTQEMSEDDFKAATSITFSTGDTETDTKLNNAWKGAVDKVIEDLKKPGPKDPPKGGLTLQIGDSSASYDQLKVQIKDMHANAMGSFDESGELIDGKDIASVDITDIDGAHDALDVIKDAINYVSSVRGQLGAIQNRLEHTQNNLSVMAENIQDAESTIRDTDVADEMMAYVKNNILIQSAQAMLAQANQVPQGVLQLLG